MAIAAKRFTYLDRETDISVLDFSSVKSSGVFNTNNGKDVGLTQDIEDFVTNNSQAPRISPLSSFDPTARSTKGSIGNIKDLTNASNQELQKLMDGIFPENDVAKASFNTLATKCKTNGMNNFNLGKPYDASIDCGGKKRKNSNGGCSTNGFSDILNLVTDGDYNSRYNDLNQALRGIISLSKIGYDMNMCGVFNAVKGTQGINLLSRASGSLLGSLGSSGNVLGVLDLANSSAGLHTVLENPKGISNVFTGFKMPTEIKEANYTDFSDRVTGSMEIFDENWDKSEVDDLMSISQITSKNNDLDKVFKSKAISKVAFDEDHLDIVSNDPSLYMSTAYSAIGSKSNSWALLGV